MARKESAILSTQGHTPPDEQIRRAVGIKIRNARQRHRQSAERVAKRLGMSRVGLTHIEKGRNNINAIQLWKLACVFGCSPSDLLPPIPDGFALTKVDYQKIVDANEEAAGWAKELFADEISL